MPVWSMHDRRLMRAFVVLIIKGSLDALELTSVGLCDVFMLHV